MAKHFDGSDKANVPANEEHIEAMQTSLDKKRYAYIASLSPEEQEKFRKMEECVVAMKGLGIPFVLLGAFEKDTTKFWRYQSMTTTSSPVAATEEEMQLISKRSFYAFSSMAKHFAEIMGSKVILQDPKGIPYYVIAPEGYYSMDIKHTAQ